MIVCHISAVSHILKDLRNLLSLLGSKAHGYILYFSSYGYYSGLFIAPLEYRSSPDQPYWGCNALVIGSITSIVSIRVYDKLSSRSEGDPKLDYKSEIAEKALKSLYVVLCQVLHVLTKSPKSESNIRAYINHSVYDRADYLMIPGSVNSAIILSYRPKIVVAVHRC